MSLHSRKRERVYLCVCVCVHVRSNSYSRKTRNWFGSVWLSAGIGTQWARRLRSTCVRQLLAQPLFAFRSVIITWPVGVVSFFFRYNLQIIYTRNNVQSQVLLFIFGKSSANTPCCLCVCVSIIVNAWKRVIVYARYTILRTNSVWLFIAVLIRN